MAASLASNQAPRPTQLFIAKVQETDTGCGCCDGSASNETYELGTYSTANRARAAVRRDMEDLDRLEQEREEYDWEDGDDDDDEDVVTVFSPYLVMPRGGPDPRSEQYALWRKAHVKTSMRSLLNGEPGAEAAFNFFRRAPWVEAWSPDGSGQVNHAPPVGRRDSEHARTVLWTVHAREIDQPPPPRTSAYGYTRRERS